MQKFVINGREDRIISTLKQYGFDGYESRAYFTLLLLGRSRAYALARKSGVPQPRIYGALNSLADNHADQENPNNDEYDK